MAESMPRNVRVPNATWFEFDGNVGARNKSTWLREFMDSVNRDPQLWKEFRALAAIRDEDVPAALLKAIGRYNAER